MEIINVSSFFSNTQPRRNEKEKGTKSTSLNKSNFSVSVPFGEHRRDLFKLLIVGEFAFLFR